MSMSPPSLFSSKYFRPFQPDNSNDLDTAPIAYPIQDYYTTRASRICHPPAYTTSANACIAAFQGPTLLPHQSNPTYSSHFNGIQPFETTESSSLTVAAATDFPPPYFAHDGPPPHLRPLYASIPLPDEDEHPIHIEEPSYEPSDEKDHHHAPSLPMPQNIELHVALRIDCSCSKSSHSRKCSGADSESADKKDPPAATPSADGLKLKADATCQKLDTRSSSVMSLDFMKADNKPHTIKLPTLIIDDGDSGQDIRSEQGKGSSELGEKLSHVASSVRVWLRTASGTKENGSRHRWRFVRGWQ